MQNTVRSKKKFCVILSILFIVCLLFCSFSIIYNNRQANALSDTSLATLAGEGDDLWSTNGHFDGAVLDDLNTKLFGTDDPVTYIRDNDIGEYTKTGSYVVPASVINANPQVNNADNGLVVTLGGVEWMVASLTLADIDSATDNVIVTLYAANANGSSQFYTSASNSAGTNVYSRSTVRNTLLNSADYSVFSSGILATNYLVQPKYIQYQQTQSIVGRAPSNWYVCPNDALGTISSGWYSGGNVYYPSYTYDGKRYDDWGNDYIWLPSITETGAGIAQTTCIWRLSEEQKKHDGSTAAWLRSGCDNTSSHNGYSLAVSSAAGCLNTYTTNTYGIRPAIHLNLTAAESNKKYKLEVPEDLSVEYDGGNSLAINSTIASWYTAEFKDAVSVEYYSSTTHAQVTPAPSDIGTYEARITIVDTNNKFWADNDANLTKKINFTVTPKKMDLPKFLNGEAQKAYNGGADVTFNLAAYDDSVIEVRAADPTEVTMSTFGRVLARKVGKYALDVELVDKDRYQWRDTGTTADRRLEFEVTKAQICIEILSSSGETALKGAEGGKLKVIVRVSQSDKEQPRGSDIVPITIVAKQAGAFGIPINQDPVEVRKGMSNADREIEVELDMSILNPGSEYTLEAATSEPSTQIGKSYTVSVTSGTTLLVEENTSNLLSWYLYGNNSIMIGWFKDAEIGETSVSLPKTLTYDGRRYTFRVTAPGGYKLDETFGVNGYLVTPANSNNSDPGKNADEYTTTVNLINKDTLEEQEYSIKWKIEQATFDLSNVIWEHNGDLPYDKTNGSIAQIDPKTLPEGLIADYSGSQTGTNVGEQGTAYLTFRLDPSYEGNYVLPIESDPTTYKFDNADKDGFEWSKTWSIVKASIQSDSWKMQAHTDANGKIFDIRVLRDPNAADGIVEYQYFECDAKGENYDLSKPLNITDIVFSENEAKYYVAKPVLLDSNNYELSDPDSLSRLFKVGKELTKVQVELESYALEYSSTPKYVKIKVSGEAVLPATAFEVTYYDGYIKLNDAPIEVGKYRVEIALKNTYTDRYEIAGNYEYEIDIVPAIIPIDWNEQAKPPVLKLKYGQINGIEYEIADGNNIVEFGDLQAGKTYQIRAIIKPEYRKNFTFEGGVYETEFKEFSVSANDTLYDPNDPKNPNYPQIDPDKPVDEPETPGGDDTKVDFGKVGEILKQWWQVIVTGVCLILTIIFLAKGIGYASKRKEAKRTTESRYKTYYATATTGLFGLSMSNWTIIACAAGGAAVLSFIFMLIEKHMYKKSKRQLEDARVEYEHNDNNRRDEDLKMILMSMLGNNGGNSQPQYATAGAQQGIGQDDVRLLVNEAVAALLPNVQAMLPQQASKNDEVVEQLIKTQENLMRNQEMLIEQIKELSANNAQERQVVEKVVEVGNSEAMDQLARNQEMLIKQMQDMANAPADNGDSKAVEKMMKNQEKLLKKLLKKEPAPVDNNDEAIEQLTRNQEALMQQMQELANAPADNNNEALESIIQKLLDQQQQPVDNSNAEVIEQLARNQEMIIKQMQELAANANKEPKVVEKIVEVPVEKVVEKIVEKKVPVEKVVEKIVKVPAEKKGASATASTRTPRLNIDEAYAKLSKEQKKYFDKLREYALSKEKSKEKKSTYYILLGQSSVNPLVKLTIKKDTTVALFKMEDEYFKDLRRNADGAKVKVKESELIVADQESFNMAKQMIDLRVDQIDRYQEYLKEQREYNKK